MYAQMALAVGDAYFGYQNDKMDAKVQKMQRDYQNTMSAISKAQSLNVQTENEIGVRDAGIRAGMSLGIQAMEDQASATAAAAAAGVKGSSVRATMRGLARSRMQAKFALHQRMKAQARADLHNRRNIGLSAVMNKDISVIPKPSAASALLGLGASMVDIYDRHQPEGSKVSDLLAGAGRY